nr:MAG TPA: hypothetical protein [Caudoviricetes sp.]
MRTSTKSTKRFPDYLPHLRPWTVFSVVLK